MPANVTLWLTFEAVLVAVIFAAVWSVCVRIRNYGFLDVTWTLTIGLLAAIDCIEGPGWPLRRLAFGLTAVAWSLRLGLFVLRRVIRHHPHEDKRYATFRGRWKTPAAFLGFFELQAAVALVFSLPFLAAARAQEPSLSALEWSGLAIAIVGILGEALADLQASVFKRQSVKGQVLDRGLWRYSRHPNYFFELVFWIGIALAAVSLSGGWMALICPVLIAYFLLRVTGVPLTEKHSLETHGEAFRDYQRRTSAFIPWFPNRTA